MAWHCMMLLSAAVMAVAAAADQLGVHNHYLHACGKSCHSEPPLPVGHNRLLCSGCNMRHGTLEILVCLHTISLEGIARCFCALCLQMYQLAVGMAMQRVLFLCCMCIMCARHHATVSLQYRGERGCQCLAWPVFTLIFLQGIGQQAFQAVLEVDFDITRVWQTLCVLCIAIYTSR